MAVAVWTFTVALLCTSAMSTSPSMRAGTKGRTDPNTKPTKLLLLLYDGMRWDSVTEDRPGMKRMMDNGVHVKSMTPCFPSSSLINYFCILTGQYAEDHGLIGNEIFDNSTGEFFRGFANNTNTMLHEPKWWRDVHPIWVDAVKQGKRVKMFSWPDCQIPMQNVTLKKDEQCVMWRPGLKTPDLRGYIEEALNALAEDKLDFAGVYYGEPDHTQHLYGLHSEPAETVIDELDGVLEFLQNKADGLKIYDSSTKLIDKLNIMLVSDHGHMNFTGSVNVTAVFDKYPATVKPSGQQLYIWPKDNTEQIFAELKKIPNMSVYHRADIPNRWHIKGGHFMSPLFAVADLGFYFIAPGQLSLPIKAETGKPLVSSHGWDNAAPEMGAVFMARGPNFTKNLHPDSIANVELYQIMCAILGITPSSNKGLWSHVQPLVIGLEPYTEPPVSFMSVIVTVVVALSLVIILTAIVCGVHYLKQRSRTKQYRTLPTMMDNEFDNDELGL